jgi:protein tyrosine phosphatase (PTP) superfamily phosphohydrolase (DUF442 family)
VTKNVALGAAVWVGPFIAGIVLVSLGANQQDRRSESKSQNEDKPFATPERLVAPGIENAFRLSPRLYSGGEPQGEGAFEALQALGVKTIVSVDGASPDIETAHKFGIRYVHLPVGYDGVPREQAVRLVQATRTLPGPVFVHCHHGKHRGPAAAALCGIAMEGWSKHEALSWLKQAGTSPDYRGLFASVDQFVAPSPEELDRVLSDLPEQAKVPAFVAAMVQVDKRWDHLKAIREAGFKAPSNEPDLDPPHEALQLAEHFRELLRLSETKGKGDDFRRKMEVAERSAIALKAALKRLSEDNSALSRRQADEAFAAAAKRCTGCHVRYRDNKPRRFCPFAQESSVSRPYAQAQFRDEMPVSLERRLQSRCLEHKYRRLA